MKGERECLGFPIASDRLLCSRITTPTVQSEVEEYVNHDVFGRVVIAEQRTVDYNTMTYKTEFAYNQAGDVLGSV